MKLEQLNFISFVKLLKMLILASQIVELNDTKQQFDEIMKKVSEYENFTPVIVNDDYIELKSMILDFFNNYGDNTLKIKIITKIDSIVTKIAL